ncbi:hypothetical protein DEH69_09435 [Streptomyces sp. PT12]|nr:hypothetical protein DEH69_09435 [Streptomyces sp. PT12]
MVVLCAPCWNVYANAMAAHDGADAAPVDGDALDGIGPWGPPLCRRCDEPVRRLPTTYERWVDLEFDELPAKQVPSRYRWRVRPITPPTSRYVVGHVAIRIRGIEPLPGERVVPAHRLRCLSPEAQAEVEAAWRYDLARAAREPGESP